MATGDGEAGTAAGRPPEDSAAARLARLEEAVVLLAELNRPKPRTLWDRLPTATIKDLIYIVGVPALLFTTYLEFDRFFISREAIRLEESRNTAIARLDQLQEINGEIYRLQTQGDGDIAFALIEAKRGQIARLTDTVFLTWSEQPEMLERHDLNALAEALLVQHRTDDALRVAASVDTAALRPIDAIDQRILLARIRFAEGPARDIEAARQHLRDALPFVERIEREGSRLLMQEKMMQVRLLNEAWSGTDCRTIGPMADTLEEVRALNAAAGTAEDRFQSALTVRTVRDICG